MAALVGIYLAAINLATFAAFALDKRAAELRAARTPERRLLWLAALGGSPGALAAQQMLRHKTRKEPFRTWLVAIAIVQAAVLAFAAYRFFR
ncbi:MAG: DUF1294 domain-containing protein [Phenylobacterium sp.]|uniref:DUF1294 domain-containing protein n=1 Tax=Phenylobacterium sp. TaxID=1871053 RepID=UPI00121E90B4|nr:DUF1294 domain-containing protein [Phenylobacterium sp.]TAJ70259.1 MAG: DUF1294 domain-containing protein [Phenylobacterium sp.]